MRWYELEAVDGKSDLVAISASHDALRVEFAFSLQNFHTIPDLQLRLRIQIIWILAEIDPL